MQGLSRVLVSLVTWVSDVRTQPKYLRASL